ncbi:DUF3267 domain-containing protein [Bacillus sp. V3-13]|uniref:DUF3267 domain-containing protein n=1 Tax=Bacillus sp. V3-13 TaxID=2053728 RepID=UPI0021532DD9|nr:DUF3267 domain-containing protein [Bacillus sp. V3-13]
MNQTENPGKVVTFSIPVVMVASLLLSIVMIIMTAILHSAFHGTANFTVNTLGFILFFVCFMVLVIVHEFFHMIGFHFAGKVPWNEIAYGVDFKKGIAYAHSKQMITVKAMKIALWLPFLVTGLLPFVIGVMLDEVFLTLLGAFLIGGCTGDFAFIFKIRKYSSNTLVKDHPTEPQFTVYE